MAWTRPVIFNPLHSIEVSSSLWFCCYFFIFLVTERRGWSLVYCRMSRSSLCTVLIFDCVFVFFWFIFFSILWLIFFLCRKLLWSYKMIQMFVHYYYVVLYTQMAYIYIFCFCTWDHKSSSFCHSLVFVRMWSVILHHVFFSLFFRGGFYHKSFGGCLNLLVQLLTRPSHSEVVGLF